MLPNTISIKYITYNHTCCFYFQFKRALLPYILLFPQESVLTKKWSRVCTNTAYTLMGQILPKIFCHSVFSINQKSNDDVGRQFQGEMGWIWRNEVASFINIGIILLKVNWRRIENWGFASVAAIQSPGGQLIVCLCLTVESYFLNVKAVFIIFFIF